MLGTIFRLYKNYKPMRFFGGLSLFLFIVTLVMFIPIFIEYARTGLVPRFPTLIVSGFIGLGGVLSLFTGLILTTLVEKERQEFEFRLNVIESMYQIMIKK